MFGEGVGVESKFECRTVVLVFSTGYDLLRCLDVVGVRVLAAPQRAAVLSIDEGRLVDEELRVSDK